MAALCQYAMIEPIEKTSLEDFEKVEAEVLKSEENDVIVSGLDIKTPEINTSEQIDNEKQSSSEHGSGDSEDTKFSVRKNMWKLMTSEKIARAPFPIFGRIPNFVGAYAASTNITQLQCYKDASNIMVAPDKCLHSFRQRVINDKKNLFVSAPNLRNCFLHKVVVPNDCTDKDIWKATSLEGIRTLSEKIGIENVEKMGLVVLGSVAVSRNGNRIGKGRGYGDLEWGLLTHLKATSESVVVITLVHDCQIVSLKDNLMQIHDLPCDVIVTPTSVINCESRKDRPFGIYWNLLSQSKCKETVLDKLRVHEESLGNTVTLMHDDKENAKAEDVVPPPSKSTKRYQDNRKSNSSKQKSRLNDVNTENKNVANNEKPKSNTDAEGKTTKANRNQYKGSKPTYDRRANRVPFNHYQNMQQRPYLKSSTQGRSFREFRPVSINPRCKPSVFVGNISDNISKSTFNNDIQNELALKPSRVLWQPIEKRAFVIFDSLHDARESIRRIRTHFQDTLVDFSITTKSYYGVM